MAYDMIEPLEATFFEQLRQGLRAWKLIGAAPGDGPLTWKEKVIWKMRKDLNIWLTGASTPAEKKQLLDEFEEWKTQIEAMERPPEDLD